MHARRKPTCMTVFLFLKFCLAFKGRHGPDRVDARRLIHQIMCFGVCFYNDADGTLHVLAPISLAAGKYNVRSTCFGDWGNSVRLHPYDSHFQFRKVCTSISLNSIFSIRNKGTHRVIQRTLYQPQGLLQGQICPVYTPFTCGVHTQKLYKHYRAGS